MQARKHRARVAAAAVSGHPEPETNIVEPLHIQGLEYHEIKVIGRGYERHLLSQLAWWSYMYVPDVLWGQGKGRRL